MGRERSSHPAASPFSGRGRAWWDGRLVADSGAAVLVDGLLAFPAADVRTEELRDEGRRSEAGDRLWSLAGEQAADPARWHVEGGARTDGADAVREVAGGLIAFDHERVTVELVEPDGESTIRFPAWGDAKDLVDVMDVRQDGAGRWVSVARSDNRRPVVEGSQMLGQSVVAAMRHTGGRRVVSAHMIFHRAADAREPLDIELDEVSAGRTFTTLAAYVGQGARRRATGTLLLAPTAQDVVTHQAEPPPCAPPEDAEPYDMSVVGREIRMVDGAYTDDPAAPVGPPVIDTWVRFREVPPDPALHAGLLAQFTGHVSLAAALRPHAGVGQREAHRTLSMGINAIAIAFHADVRADRWLRYHHLSTFAGDGMTHSECRVYGEDGALVASFTVDAMLRAMAAGADARTAI